MCARYRRSAWASTDLHRHRFFEFSEHVEGVAGAMRVLLDAAFESGEFCRVAPISIASCVSVIRRRYVRHVPRRRWDVDGWFAIAPSTSRATKR